MKTFENKTVLITGGASGIGKATAIAFGKRRKCGRPAAALLRESRGDTNTGLWGNIPPTGKIAKFSAVNIFRFANGKVVEVWNHLDDLGLMQQLGAPNYAGSHR